MRAEVKYKSCNKDAGPMFALTLVLLTFSWQQVEGRPMP